MDNFFKKNEEWFTFYDVEGNKIERKTEIRFDPLTNESSRLVFDPGLALTPPDYTEAAEQTSGKNCPFCPENINKVTPVFSKDIAEEGRISYGQSTVFPNLFPYSKHNGVVVFSDQHYVRLNEFTDLMIKDAFMTGQAYIQRILSNEDGPLYTSINWNYLPYSGGSILHPHLHVIVSETPTNYQAIFEASNRMFKQTRGEGEAYYSYLAKNEKQLEERWIGEHGDVQWMHAFAPKSHNDFIAVFPNATAIEQITEEDWTHFAEGLQAVFATLSEQNIASFNMLLTAARDGSSPVHVRLIPRLTLGGLGTSDINYFQALHQEPLTYKVPEEVAEKARVHFSKL